MKYTQGRLMHILFIKFIDINIAQNLTGFQLLPPANEVWGKVIFSEACVKNSVHEGRSTWAGTPPPGTRYTCHPLTRYTFHPLDQVQPPDQVHPPGPGTSPRTRYTPWDQVHPRDQCTPPGPGIPLRPGTPPDQVHPPGPGTPPRSSACWEIRATRGRYASYWNAFLSFKSERNN